MTQKRKFYQFSLDFAPVAVVPEDIRNRREYFKVFRSILEAEHQKILAWHRAGAGGRDVVQANTGLMDEAIKHLAQTLDALSLYDKGVLDKFALIAVGGYGRGELNPHSDIDLLFLLPQKGVKPVTNKFIQDFISILWGVGLEIGQSVRGVKDCVALAKEDTTIQTSMLDMRFLLGEQSLFENLKEALRKKPALKNIRKLLSDKIKERTDSACSTGEQVFSPEPDVKYGVGGLRDYHASLWGVRSYFGSPSFMEMGEEGGLSHLELTDYLRSVEFFLRVRNELHYLSNKKKDSLNREIQTPLVLNLGYKKESDQSAVKRFMRDYFLHAANIYNCSDIIFNRCLHHKQTVINKVITSFQRKELGDGFYAIDNQLHCGKDIGMNWKQNPRLCLKAIELCKMHRLELSSEVKRRIRLHLPLLAERFGEEETTRKFFLILLEDPAAGKYLRMMHECGLLGKVLPEYGKTECLIRYDLYHRFTADEHSLRMAGFLDSLSSTKDPNLLELSKIFQTTKKKAVLRLAALLHSLGEDSKNEDANQQQKTRHSVAVANRLHLPEEDRITLEFLLSHLSDMTEIALHHEFQHPETVPEFANRIGSSERLDLLYLISYADLKAAAPDTWTPWKQFLLSELFYLAKKHQLDPKSPREKSLSTRFDVFSKLQKDFFAWEIERHFELMPSEYLQLTPSTAVALHIRILRSLESEPFVLDISHNPVGMHFNLSLACLGNKEPLKNLVGVLTAKNLNILGAQIFQMQNDMIIATIQAGGQEDLLSETDPLWLEVEQDLGEVLAGKEAMQSLLSRRKRYVSLKTRVGTIKPRIQIDNKTSSEYTIIRAEAKDHLGMLYKIVKTLSDFGVQIHHAKIALNGGKGVDVFYVTLGREKIRFKRLTQQIRDRLIQILLIEDVEDAG